MIDLNNYIKDGLLKRQNPNFKQILKQIERADKDLKTVNLVINKDPEWASTIAYHAMIRTGRALIFANGYLPTDGQQHKTVVEITGKFLGNDLSSLIRQFNKLRKKRNSFFYESEDANNFTEAKIAVNTAKKLISAIKQSIIKLNPQIIMKI